MVLRLCRIQEKANWENETGVRATQCATPTNKNVLQVRVSADKERATNSIPALHGFNAMLDWVLNARARGERRLPMAAKESPRTKRLITVRIDEGVMAGVD